MSCDKTLNAIAIRLTDFCHPTFLRTCTRILCRFRQLLSELSLCACETNFGVWLHLTGDLVLHGIQVTSAGPRKRSWVFSNLPRRLLFSPGFPRDSDRTSDTSVASPVSPRPIVRDPSFLGAFAFAMMLWRQEPPRLSVLISREGNQLVHSPRCLPSLRTLRAIRTFTMRSHHPSFHPDGRAGFTVIQHRERTTRGLGRSRSGHARRDPTCNVSSSGMPPGRLVRMIFLD